MKKSEHMLKILAKRGPSPLGYTIGQLAGMVGSTKDTVRSQISILRSEGHAIFSQRRATPGAIGRPKTFYALGEPTPDMVALSHAVYGASAFTR